MNFPVNLIFLLISFTYVFDGDAQNRKISGWKGGGNEIIIFYGPKNEKGWRAKFSPRVELPAILKADDRREYVLFNNGSWILKKDITSLFKVTYRCGAEGAFAETTNDQVLTTQSLKAIVQVESVMAIKNLRMVVKRNKLAIRHVLSTATSDFPRNLYKASQEVDLADKKAVFDLELSMCENKIGLYLPSGDPIMEFAIDRTHSDHLYSIKDTVTQRGIFIGNKQFPKGESVLIDRTQVDMQTNYTIMNPNEFDVTVSLGFGSAYTIEFPYILGGKLFQHPPSAEAGMVGLRTADVVIKAHEKVSEIKAYLDDCEYAKEPFRLNVSSVKPVPVNQSISKSE